MFLIRFSLFAFHFSGRSIFLLQFLHSLHNCTVSTLTTSSRLKTPVSNASALVAAKERFPFSLSSLHNAKCCTRIEFFLRPHPSCVFIYDIPGIAGIDFRLFISYHLFYRSLFNSFLIVLLALFGFFPIL